MKGQSAAAALLLHAGAPARVTNANGKSPAQMAAEKGHAALAAQLHAAESGALPPAVARRMVLPRRRVAPVHELLEVGGELVPPAVGAPKEGGAIAARAAVKFCSRAKPSSACQRVRCA